MEDLMRFVETCSADSRLIRRVSESEFNESLKSCDSNLKESVNSEKVAWWIPISYYEKVNKNNRNYGKKLWENVINKQKDRWLGSPMLVDHPSDNTDGTPEKICGVWLDCKLGESNRDGSGLVFGLLAPSGRLGEDLQDHLAKGLRAGTSSSGFGHLKEDGVTVDPDSYLIERLADWVLNPSQGTYFKYGENSNIINASDSMRESAELRENVKQGENTIIMPSLSKLEEKRFRRDMESFLERAEVINDPQAKLREYEEIESFFEEGACPDLREKVEQKIADQKALIQKSLVERAEMSSIFNIKDTQDLKEKLTKIAEDVSAVKAQAKDWKAIAENLQEKLRATQAELAARPTNSYVEYQKNKLARAYSEKASLQKTIESLNTQLGEATAENKKILTENDEYSTKLTSIIEEQRKIIAADQTKLSEAREYSRKLEKCVLHAESQFDNYVATLEEKNHPQFGLTPAQKVAKFVDFREGNNVDKYYNMLEERYGKVVSLFEETIKSCKTVEDAKATFFRKVLPNL